MTSKTTKKGGRVNKIHPVTTTPLNTKFHDNSATPTVMPLANNHSCIQTLSNEIANEQFWLFKPGWLWSEVSFKEGWNCKGAFSCPEGTKEQPQKWLTEALQRMAILLPQTVKARTGSSSSSLHCFLTLFKMSYEKERCWWLCPPGAFHQKKSHGSDFNFMNLNQKNVFQEVSVSCYCKRV